MSPQEQAFDDGIRAGGGLSQLAGALEVSIQTLSNWRARGVPPNRVKRFEALTGISARRLRPDDWHEYWPDLAPTLPPTEPAQAGG